MENEEIIKEIKRVLELVKELESRLRSLPADEKTDERLDKITEDINDLLERVHKLELIEVENQRTWRALFYRAVDWTMKAVLFIGASYVIAKLGLDNIAIPSPF